MTQQPSPSSNKKILYAIAAGAFLLRLLVLIVFKTYWYKEAGFGSGFEVGMISRSLAEGHGFASPFGGDTGPTAWIAPLYPGLQALVFKVFGIQSLASAFVMRLINSAAAPVMCIVLFRIASRLWNDRFGLVAAFAWAIFPDSVWVDTALVWSTMLATMLLFMVVELVVVRPEHPSTDSHLGVITGVIALLDPSPLTAAGMCLLWRWRSRKQGRFRSIAITLLIAAGVTLPWSVRNYVVFRKPVFLRSNFGHELYKGNFLGATGENATGLNPYGVPAEFMRYQEMGELNYVADHKRQAIAAIKQYPGWFFKLVRRRMDMFWNGPAEISSMFTFEGHVRVKKVWYTLFSLLGLGGLLVALLRREPFAALFAAIVIVYPLIYYVTFPTVRYRLPLEPILLFYSLHLGAVTFKYVRRRFRYLGGLHLFTGGSEV